MDLETTITKQLRSTKSLAKSILGPEPSDETKAGPNFVYRANLVVDESGRQEHVPKPILGDVGWNFRTLLWPATPQAAAVDEVRKHVVKVPLQSFH